jgi:putative holliday junction resolvase
VDVGSVRVGVAISDADGLVATPLTTLTRDPAHSEAAGAPGLAMLADLAAERAALEIVIGLPRSLAGGEGPAARAARSYAEALARVLAARAMAVPIRLVDERWSTVHASRLLRGSGTPGGERQRRTVIDQAAAAVILQAALDNERAVGSPPGEAMS